MSKQPDLFMLEERVHGYYEPAVFSRCLNSTGESYLLVHTNLNLKINLEWIIKTVLYNETEHFIDDLSSELWLCFPESTGTYPNTNSYPSMT